MLLVPGARDELLYRKMALVVTGFLCARVIETFHHEHYSAPVWAAIGLMVAVWAERTWHLRFRGLPAGKAAVLLALLAPPVVAMTHRTQLQDGWPARRVALVKRLSGLTGDQLVVVRYPAPKWNVIEEWVYNGADIDREKVVFAHDLGAEEDRVLLNYYPNRTKWLLTFDPVSQEDRIQAYPGIER